MKKLIAILTAALLIVSVLTACGQASNPDSSSATPAEKATINAVAIAGPTGVGLVDLMQNNKLGKAANNYKFTVVTDPQQAIGALVNKSADIAAVPTNLASTLYGKTNGNVQVLAVNTLGVLSILENGNTIMSVADLKGKTIYTSGQGANPEYILRYVLEKNNIDPDKDVKIEFVQDNDALATLVKNNTAKVAMVPEPKATVCLKQNTAVRIALDMTKEWNKVSDDDSRLMMGCVVARKDFVQANADAVKKFLAEYKASIGAVVTDVPNAAQLCASHGIIPQAPIAQEAIPNCNLTYVDGAEMKKQLHGYLKVLFDYNPKAIGGAMPADDFYYAG